MACGYGACYGCAVQIRGRAEAALRRGARARREGGGVILNASGCLDALTAPDVARSLDAFVTKTVTPLPREGNPPLRIAETDCGMLNSIGLANPGIDRFLEENLPRLLELGVPIWVSVGGFARGRVRGHLRPARRAGHRGDRAERLLPERRVARRRRRGDRHRGARGDVEAALHEALAERCRTSPPRPFARPSAGTDGLSLVNTLRGLALDRADARADRRDRERRPLGTRRCGPVALAAVYACYQATGLPIVGMGGVETGRHALELIAAGASAVALGTVLFARSRRALPRTRRAGRGGGALARLRPVRRDARGVAHRLLSDRAKTPAKTPQN